MVKLLSPEELKYATQGRGYIPFEYWTGPKRVIPRHARKGSSKSITPRQQNLAEHRVGRHAAQSYEKLGDTKRALFGDATPLGTTNKSMPCETLRGTKAQDGPFGVGRLPAHAGDTASSLSDMAAYERDEKHPWYNFRYWRKRVWALVIVSVAVIVVVPVVVAVLEVELKKNRYPDYGKLNYTLSDTCK